MHHASFFHRWKDQMSFHDLDERLRKVIRYARTKTKHILLLACGSTNDVLMVRSMFHKVLILDLFIF